MPNCSKIIIKGKNKGKECGEYTTKKLDNKYYCAGHYKCEISKKDENKFKINFDVDYNDEDEMIEIATRKIVNGDNAPRDLTTAKFNHVNDKINNISKKLDDIYNFIYDKHNNDNDFEEFR